jgi:transcriptional regulator with XRE-family HTH domain
MSNEIGMKQLREKAGLTAQELAVALGISISTVHSWEQGRAIPQFQMIKPLMRTLRVTFDQLEEAVESSLQLKGRSLWQENK